MNTSAIGAIRLFSVSITHLQSWKRISAVLAFGLTLLGGLPSGKFAPASGQEWIPRHSRQTTANTHAPAESMPPQPPAPLLHRVPPAQPMENTVVLGNPGSKVPYPAFSASPPHLVIEAPQPLHRHHRIADNQDAAHAAVRMAHPEAMTHPETVGGGHWNAPPLHVQNAGNPHPGTASHLPLKKSIHDLSHHIPSHAHKAPAPTAIPEAPRITGWKQPYSYGHFGAKHNRQLSVHHGHQRSYTQLNIR